MMRGGDWLVGLNRLRDDSQVRHEWVPTYLGTYLGPPDLSPTVPLEIRY